MQSSSASASARLPLFIMLPVPSSFSSVRPCRLAATATLTKRCLATTTPLLSTCLRTHRNQPQSFSTLRRRFQPNRLLPSLASPSFSSSASFFTKRTFVTSQRRKDEISPTAELSPKEGPPAATKSGASSNRTLIFEASQEQFQAQVLIPSGQVPVIVDCYADWCTPCKTLTPALEQEVKRLNGRVLLAKLNTDHNQALAQQLGVTNLPTVFALYQGKLVDSFMGVLPADQLRKWVDRVGGIAGELDHLASAEELFEEAEQRLKEGDITGAAEAYGQVLKENVEETVPVALAGLARCALEEGNLEAAKDLTENLKRKFSSRLSEPLIKKAVSAVDIQLEFRSKFPSGLSSSDFKQKEEALLQKINANNNAEDTSTLDALFQDRYDLASLYLVGGRPEEAIEQLLEILKRNKYWKEDAARQLLFKVFTVLGEDNELTVQGRKRLANIWFS
ncbi:Thioredoxin [Balamuthia mandrillaris]